MLSYSAVLLTLILHLLVLALGPDRGASKEIATQEPIKLKFKQIKVRKVGQKNRPDTDNLMGQLAYGQQDLKRVDQQVSQKSSSLSKKKEKEIVEDARKQSVTRNQYMQKKISKESFAQKNWTNELSHVQDASVSFLPPKGITPDQLNEFEKVFYAFYKRVAIQYINSVQISVRNRVNERPYVQNTLMAAEAQELKAVIRYDELGNAEIVKILSSSKNDDIHKIFEDALGKMDKIPNIVKDLKDEDGKYYAIFSLSINTRR